MKKNIHVLALFASLIIAPTIIYAASVFDIQYPISELGNCASREECKTFCDTPGNEELCLKWAQDKGLAPKPQPQNQQDSSQNFNQSQDKNTGNDRKGNEQQRMINEEAFKNAPGGCKTPRECDLYCRVEEHLGECLDYSVKYGYTTKEEADKILSLSKKGGPGGCKGPEQCDAFCKQPTNARVCMQFVVEEGKITQEEAEVMIAQMEKGPMKGKRPGEGKGSGEPKLQKEKALEVLKTKAGPGGCKNEEECKAYCSEGVHMQECMNFAKENKLMNDEDIRKMEKLSLSGPGGCKGPEECDAFCGKEENRETCMNFSKENGLMSEEEIQMMEKQMSIIKKLNQQVGPGGCKSREECNKFCSDQNNIETCINFSGQQGMLSPDSVKQMMGQSAEAKQKIQEFQQYQQKRPMNQRQDSQYGTFQPKQGQGDRQFMPPENQNCEDGNCPPPMQQKINQGDERYKQFPQNCEGDNCPQPKQDQYMQPRDQRYPQPSQDCRDGKCTNFEGGQYIPSQSGQYQKPLQGTQQYMPPQGTQSMPQERPDYVPQYDGQYPPPTGSSDRLYQQPSSDGQYIPTSQTQYQQPQQEGQQIMPSPVQEQPQQVSYDKVKNVLANVLAFFLGK